MATGSTPEFLAETFIPGPGPGPLSSFSLPSELATEATFLSDEPSLPDGSHCQEASQGYSTDSSLETGESYSNAMTGYNYHSTQIVQVMSVESITSSNHCHRQEDDGSSSLTPLECHDPYEEPTDDQYAKCEASIRVLSDLDNMLREKVNSEVEELHNRLHDVIDEHSDHAEYLFKRPQPADSKVGEAMSTENISTPNHCDVSDDTLSHSTGSEYNYYIFKEKVSSEMREFQYRLQDVHDEHFDHTELLFKRSRPVDPKIGQAMSTESISTPNHCDVSDDTLIHSTGGGYNSTEAEGMKQQCSKMQEDLRCYRALTRLFTAAAEMNHALKNKKFSFK